MIAAIITTVISIAFPPLSFGWPAWSALGDLAIAVIWPYLIGVDHARVPDNEADRGTSSSFILFAAAIGIAISGLGLFYIVEGQFLIYGLGGLFIWDRLLKNTVGYR